MAQRQGNKRATVALARKMAVVMHRMWVDGTTFRFSAVEAPAAATAQHLAGHRDRGWARLASKGRPHGDGREVKPE